MNDTLLAAELGAVFEGDAGLIALIPYIHAEQSGESTQRPSLSISGTFENFSRHRKGTVTFELLSRTGDEEAATEANTGHQTQFEAVWTKLFGAKGANAVEQAANLAAAKAALKAAVEERGKIRIIEYGPGGESTVESDTAEDDLRARLRIRVAFAFI